MIAQLEVKPTEKGTAVITMSFIDQAGESVMPYSLQWQLMRKNGAVVNGRTFANGSLTGTHVVLTGNDLAMFGDGDGGVRVFSVQGEYDSSIGTGLKITGECIFKIESLLGQVDITGPE